MITPELILEQMNKGDQALSHYLQMTLQIALSNGDDGFVKWIKKELTGYENGNDVPEYRKVRGDVVALHIYNGAIPVDFEDLDMGELLTERGCCDPIAALEEGVSNLAHGNILGIPIPEAIAKPAIQRNPGVSKLILQVSKHQFAAIISNVATKLTEYLVAVSEADNGASVEKIDTMSGAKTELHISSPKDCQFNLNSGNGVVEVRNELVSTEKLAELIDLIRKAIEDPEFDAVRNELRADVDSMAAQSASPKPKALILKESLHSIKRIFEGITASSATVGVLELIKLISG